MQYRVGKRRQDCVTALVDDGEARRGRVLQAAPPRDPFKIGMTGFVNGRIKRVRV